MDISVEGKQSLKYSTPEPVKETPPPVCDKFSSSYCLSHRTTEPVLTDL